MEEESRNEKRGMDASLSKHNTTRNSDGFIKVLKDFENGSGWHRRYAVSTFGQSYPMVPKNQHEKLEENNLRLTNQNDKTRLPHCFLECRNDEQHHAHPRNHRTSERGLQLMVCKVHRYPIQARPE